MASREVIPVPDGSAAYCEFVNSAVWHERQFDALFLVLLLHGVAVIQGSPFAFVAVEWVVVPVVVPRVVEPFGLSAGRVLSA